MIQLDKKPANHIINAYNHMITEMRLSFEQAEAHAMTLQYTLETAKNQVVRLGYITAEEAYEIGENIKRDVNDAADDMMESGDAFYDWLLLDVDIIERKVMALFLSVADQTRIELEQFKQTTPEPEQRLIEKSPVYRCGDITEPGVLLCKNCGKLKGLLSGGKISTCSRCKNDVFLQQNKTKR
ncbi:MAG: hypothetical protein COB77_00065 [Gammaproteobacteria bacterium]|nr:MAG: hypothetical protein COB77_00065 [Gammaproteobacteria bacterium]